jgi:hypothetical protein
MKRKPGRAIRLTAVFCALFLLLPVPAEHASAAADVYFPSVNDKLLELSTDTMPEVVSGVLYVPYTVFDGNTTGVNLGIFPFGNKLQNTFILYNRQKTLVFDLSANNSYDSAQNIYRYMAITRNNKLYLPASFVCDFFDLTYSYVVTSIAPLIRISKPGDVVLDDKTFISAATTLMQSRYSTYLLSLSSSTQPETPASSGGDTVSNPAPETPAEEAVQVHLSFLCSGGETTLDLLNTLDDMGMYGLFLFPPDQLADNDDLIRRILGSGHAVGFAVPDSGETSLSLLTEGNLLLRVIARSAARIVSVPGLKDAERSQLEQAGWTCWTTTMNGVYSSVTSYTAATKIIAQLEKQDDAVFLQMDDGAVSLGALPRVLRFLDSGGFTVCKSYETLFLCS